MWSNNPLRRKYIIRYKDITWAKPLNYVLLRIYHITPVVGQIYIKTCSKAMADIYKRTRR